MVQFAYDNRTTSATSVAELRLTETRFGVVEGEIPQAQPRDSGCMHGLGASFSTSNVRRGSANLGLPTRSSYLPW